MRLTVFKSENNVPECPSRFVDGHHRLFVRILPNDLTSRHEFQHCTRSVSRRRCGIAKMNSPINTFLLLTSSMTSFNRTTFR